jgi:hypothetical protein
MTLSKKQIGGLIYWRKYNLTCPEMVELRELIRRYNIIYGKQYNVITTGRNNEFIVGYYYRSSTIIYLCKGLLPYLINVMSQACNGVIIIPQSISTKQAKQYNKKESV